MKHCEFPDLIVQTKLLLADILALIAGATFKHINNPVHELLFTCVDKHYGQLPKIFALLVNYIDLNEENIHEFEAIYFQSKTMIMNKTCACDVTTIFATTAPDFLLILAIKNDIKQDLIFLKNLVQFEMKHLKTISLHKALANILVMERNFHDAIQHIEIYQEIFTQAHGRNIQTLIFCYHKRCFCYIQIGNRGKAKSALKQFKIFAAAGVQDYSEDISDFEKEIKKMPKNKKSHKKTKISMSTKSKCSSYDCENVELRSCEFQICSKCEIVKYCSRKCQVQHWKDAHKKECKKIMKKRGKN